MDLESRLQGSRGGRILEELLTNSLHFPLANVFLELLLEGPGYYLRQPDLYVILGAGMVQAWVIGAWRFRGRSWPLLGNLIGPAIYTAVEVPLEGMKFFASPNHTAYWAVALLIGVLQAGQARVPQPVGRVLLVLEHVTRTSILLLMYAFFEGMTEQKYATLRGFLTDPSHQYIVIVILLLGVIVGFANLTSREYLAQLRATAGQLRRYSSWLLGPQLLLRAMEDPDALGMQRRERCVLFMDIRGFTGWSETVSAERVVEMLNGYFATAEQVLEAHAVVKAQFIGDEVMCVLADAGPALVCARNLSGAAGRLLSGYGLAAGIGLHRGVVTEGLIGAREIKSFTVIGDTVNTAKRVCDQAAGGEVLITEPLRQTLPENPSLGPARSLQLKGKRDALTVHPLV